MSTTPVAARTASSPVPLTCRKRTASKPLEDDIPPLKLDTNNNADKVDEALPPRKCRKLPSFIGAEPTATPSSSQESEKMEVNNLDTLQRALAYIEERIDAAKSARMERYEMCGDSPKGSENSFVVSYSQDSKLSGDEPPGIEHIIGIVLETLPEARLQQDFPFGNIDETAARVKIAMPYLVTDLKFLSELVKEAMAALRVSAQ
jgi:hypothetical protein